MTTGEQEFTAETLAQFNGVNGCPIYISVLGVVYDVSAGRDFYGPGASYHCFVGKDSSRSLAKMQINDLEANASWRNLNEEHMKTLQEWRDKYQSKYPVVGLFRPDSHFEIRGATFQP